MTLKTPPQPLLNFVLDPSAILNEANALIAASAKVWDEIAQISPEDATFGNAILPLIHDENRLMRTATPLTFLHNISSIKETRAASKEANENLNRARVDRFSRQGVFQVVDAVWNKHDAIDPESSLYLENLRDQFIKTGQALQDAETKARVQQNLIKTGDLGTQYLRNIDYDVTGLWLTLDELRGVPQPHLDRWKADGDKRWVDHKMPNHTAVMRNAVSDKVRQKVWLDMENRMKDQNSGIIKEILILRDQNARALGYKHHAELRESDRILKTDEAAQFLQAIRGTLQEVGKHELASLKALKANKAREDGSEASTLSASFFPWDRAFFERVERENDYKLDTEKIAEYFPFDRCLPRLLSLLGALFGVTFSKCAFGKPESQIWHPDVFAYEVWNGESRGGDFLGYLYFDVFPRDHKYSHTGHFRLQPGFTKEDGTRYYPCSAFVTNYSPPSDSLPSLLKSREVVSCFHELGHALHNLCSKTNYARFHGTATPRDFVEIPSIMLEYIFWNPNILRMISGHFQSDEDAEKEEKLPDEVIYHLIEAQYANEGLSNLSTLWFSLYDQKIHTPANHEAIRDMNLAREFNKMRADITLVQGVEQLGLGLDEVKSFCRFRFPIGYNTSYYTYLLSRSLSYDIFESKFRPLLPAGPSASEKPIQDINDIVPAKLRQEFSRYRDIVLEPGANVTSYLDLLKEFLGREANFDAWIGMLRSQIPANA